MKNRRKYIILSGILWGSTSIFINMLSPLGFSSSQIVMMRAVVSSVILAAYALFFDKTLFKANWKEVALYAGSGISLFGCASSYCIAMQMTSVSKAVIIIIIRCGISSK